jgi:hypothetical protein
MKKKVNKTNRNLLIIGGIIFILTVPVILFKKLGQKNPPVQHNPNAPLGSHDL